MNDPLSTVGTMINTTGRVPTNIGANRKSSMPHRTLVGQSGPPTKIAHFAGDRPGFCKTCLIVRISLLLIPTFLRTATLFLNGTPMHSVCVGGD